MKKIKINVYLYSMNDYDRFSVMLLEKDVLEYHYFKKKYNEYDNKTKSKWRWLWKNHNEKMKIKWYNKYLSKMNFLEKAYRKDNIYTRYHYELEQPSRQNEPVIASVIDSIPSAPQI